MLRHVDSEFAHCIMVAIFALHLLNDRPEEITGNHAGF